MKVDLVEKVGPLFISERFPDTKDPAIVHDGSLWHIFGSGGSIEKEEWQILHAIAPDLTGPWIEIEPAILHGLTGFHVAAPGVVYDKNDKKFHMSIQQDFMNVGGSIHYLVSDNGHEFHHIGEILLPEPEKGEAGLYDPHFSEIDGKKYMVYAGLPKEAFGGRPFVPQPDVYLSESETEFWSGPWKRVGKILDHDDISWHHNSRDFPDYEWGIEGPQIVKLRDGRILLNATCFITEGERGTRQRVFFAFADKPGGPYKSVGPVVKNENEWELGENGHASVHVMNSRVYLFYQGRPRVSHLHSENKWKYGLAVFEIKDIEKNL